MTGSRPPPGVAADLWAAILRAREARTLRPAKIEPVGPGEESVWDFPRPPRVEPVTAAARVVFDGRDVAKSARTLRIVETTGAPVYYFPPEDVDRTALALVAGYETLCEWKGVARYFDLVGAGRRSEKAAFTVPEPFDDLAQGYARVAGWIAFYPDRADACFLDEERVGAQPGGFYAGWVTARLRGPIKGAPGSEGW